MENNNIRTFKCDDCQLNDPSVNCEKCESYFCKECSDQIHKHRVFREHVLDVIHRPKECPLCDHFRTCQKDRIYDLPKFLVHSLDASNQVKESIRASYSDSINQITKTFKYLQDLVDKVYKEKLKLVEQIYNQLLTEYEGSNTALQSISSHTRKKICECDSLKQNIHSLLNCADPLVSTRKMVCVSVNTDTHSDSLCQVLDAMISIRKISNVAEETNTISSCCRCIVDVSVSHHTSPSLDVLLRSDGVAGSQLYSLWQYANLQKGHLYTVEYNLGFECVMLRPVDESQRSTSLEMDDFDIPKRLQAYKLRCSDNICLISLNVQNDSGDAAISIEDGRCWAFDIRSGNLLSVQRDHLVRIGKPQKSTVAIGCIFEPILGLNMPYKWNTEKCRAVFENSVFRLHDFKESKSGRCIFQLIFLKPDIFEQRSLLNYISTDFKEPEIECMQAIDVEPDFMPSTAVPPNQEAIIVSVRSENCVFAQLEPRAFAQLEAKLSRCSQDEASVLKHPRVGKTCLSKYDNMLCRGIVAGFITEKNGKSYYILYYIDYGNIELCDIGVHKLYRIPCIVDNLPITVKRLSLADFGLTNNCDIKTLRGLEGSVMNLSSFKKRQLGKPAILTWVDLKQQRVYLRKSNDEDLRFISHSLHQPGGSGNIHVTRSAIIGDIANLSTIVQIYCKNRQCMCRGIIEERSSGKISVRLIDYGDLMENVSVSTLMSCPDDLAECPAQARRSIVDGAKPFELFAYLPHVNTECTIYTAADDEIWPSISPEMLYAIHTSDDPVVKIECSNVICNGTSEHANE